MTAMIRVESLSKRYGPTLALDDVSFEVARGEVVGLLGPNGAGKTTCMRMITGFVAPSAGRALLRGPAGGGGAGGASAGEGAGELLDVAHAGPRARALVGYLPESAPLYREMRVEAYLDFRAKIRGLGGRAARRRAIDRVIEACRLAEVRRAVIGRLSKGFRQRVGLADALLAEPPVLVLDEPGAGLDPNQMRELRELIAEIGRERTVLLSSHLLAEVEAVCQRVLIVHRGRLVAEDRVEALRASARHAVTAVVRCDVERARAALEALDQDELGVTVTAEEQGARCEISGDASAELRARVAELLAPLELVELAVARPRLEQVFAELTEGESGDPR